MMSVVIVIELIVIKMSGIMQAVIMQNVVMLIAVINNNCHCEKSRNHECV